MRICRRCSLAEETNKDRSGRSSLEKHGPRSPPRGERKGDEKSREAKHDRRCRCELEMRDVREREFIPFREISLQQRQKYVVKFKIVGDCRMSKL